MMSHRSRICGEKIENMVNGDMCRVIVRCDIHRCNVINYEGY